MQKIESWGGHLNWTCPHCGDQGFDNDEDWFVGHVWDCEEYYSSMEEEE
jgi:hypothetical protein